MKILVTGGAGYVGSTLVPTLLEAGHEVCVYDALLHGGNSLLSIWSHPRFRFVRGDIRDFRLLESSLKGQEAVVHLAAIVGDPACSRQPDLARSVNLEASLNLLKTARHVGVNRLVFASTCSNYGKMANPDAYVDETSELRPVSLYAQTKVGVERAILEQASGSDFCPILLRLATVFGVSPRMRFDLTVNEFTMEMFLKKRLVVFGDQFWRPYIHVKDVARAMAMVLEAPESLVSGQVYNVGSTEQNYQKRGIVNLISPLVPDAVVEFVHKNEDPRDYRVSFAKIAERLHFQITKTVEQGIHEVARIAQSGLVADFTAPSYRN